MSDSKYREWILDTIDSLRSRKARPDLERICRMVRRRHGSDPDRTCAELDKLIQEQTVLKVNYKGSISYRNAAKVQRRSRKKDDTSTRRNVVEEASHSDLSNGDSALGPTDQDETEDLEADGSTVMDTDSNGDEDGAEESRDGQDGPSPSHTYEDAATLCAFSAHAFSAPCSPMGPRPAPSPVSGADAASAPAWKSGERASSLPPSSPRAPVHSDWALGARSPAEHQQREVKAGAVRPAVPAVATSVAALKNNVEAGRTESISSDQLVPDYGANGARAEATRKVCDGRAQTLPVSTDNGTPSKKSADTGPVATAEEPIVNGGDPNKVCVKKEKTGQNLLQWSVSDVAGYFSAAGFPEQSMAFRTQEIDGKSLLLMQRSDVLTGLSIRLGPALKIYERHIKVLQRTHFLEDEDL
ncbi:sterile alpha motif domain containing 1a isoform X1 [Gadus morhua]|uniref:sterile alpha motif domain containing 1a isoform X1 n=1 Tax=Gadus morhua TaxID=8049 RepID=UPI0011B73717|nr:atherin-like isoform X1 [Gadus morhua]